MKTRTKPVVSHVFIIILAMVSSAISFCLSASAAYDDRYPVFSSASQSDGGDGSEYIYEPAGPGHSIIDSMSPQAFEGIHDTYTAISAISSLLTGLTPEQLESGDSLDGAALWIENAAKRGASGQIAGENVNVDANTLIMLVSGVSDIMDSTENLLSTGKIALLRGLRHDVMLHSSEQDRLKVSFDTDVHRMDFDRLTIEAPFASLTVDKGELTGYQSFEIYVFSDDQDTPIETDIEQDETLSEESNDGFSLASIFRFWAVLPILVIVLFLVFNEYLRKRLRMWVAPTFIGIFIIANVLTFFFMTPANDEPAEFENEALIDENVLEETQEDENSSLAAAPEIEDISLAIASDPENRSLAIAVELENISMAVLSIPVTSETSDYLVIFDEKGQPVYSKYNPATNTIDARIRESGVYAVRENKVNFIDIDKENPMMQEAILQLASKGIMTGTTDGMFFPDKMITRAEFVSAIVKMFDLTDTNAESSFADIDKSDWYYSAAATAQREGIVSGFGDNTFRGDLDMPKGQMIEASSNTLISQMDYRVPQDVSSLLARYVDREDFAGWSLAGIALATKANVLIYRADTRFASTYPMTRGDAAIILNRIFMKIW